MLKDTNIHKTKKTFISVFNQPSLFNLSDIIRKKVKVKFSMEDSIQ